MGDCFGGRGDVHHVELEQQVDGDRHTHSVLLISMLLEILTEDVVFRGMEEYYTFSVVGDEEILSDANVEFDSCV